MLNMATDLSNNTTSGSGFAALTTQHYLTTYENFYETFPASEFKTMPSSVYNHTTEEAAESRGSRYICITTQEISTTINIVAICIGLVIIFGNFLVLFVLFRYPAPRFAPFNWLLCHLAVADFVIGLTVFWWYGVAEILQIQISNLQKVGFYGASVVSVLASLEGLMMIALDRYYLILRPRKYTQTITRKRLALTIVVMWILPSILELIIPLSGWSCVDKCDCRIHNVSPDDVYCFGHECSQILPPLTKLQLSITGIVSLLMFVVTIFLYAVIFCGVQKQTKRMKTFRSPSRPKPKSPKLLKEPPVRMSALTPQSPTEFSTKRTVAGWRNNLTTVEEHQSATEPRSFRFSTYNKTSDTPSDGLGVAETPLTPNASPSKTVNRQESKISNVTTMTELSLSSEKLDSPPEEVAQFQLGPPVKRRSAHLKSDSENLENNNSLSNLNNSPVKVNLRPKSLLVVSQKNNLAETNRKSMSTVFKSTFNRLTKRGKRRTSASRKRDLRVMRSMFIILSVFVATTAPLMFFVIYTYMHNDRDLKEIFNYLLQVTTLNSLLNPFLYFWRIPYMRKKLFQLVHANYFDRKWRHSYIWRRLHPGKKTTSKPNIREVSEPSWESADSSMHE